MKAVIETMLKPLAWEDCGEDMGHCADTIIGRYWVVMTNGAYTVVFITMKHEREETEQLVDGLGMRAAKRHAWDHYLTSVSSAFVDPENSDTSASILAGEQEEKPVAWLIVKEKGEKEVRTRAPKEGSYVSSTALSLTRDGPVIAWRWTDSEGFNADFRYSFVDPREHEDEVEAQGAYSVGRCEELYIADIS